MRTIPSVANVSPVTSMKKDDDFIDEWEDFTAEKKPVKNYMGGSQESKSKPMVPPKKVEDDDGWGDMGGDPSPRKGAVGKTLLGMNKKQPLSRSSKVEEEDDLLDNVLDAMENSKGLESSK